MEIAALTSFLAPCLPILLRAGDAAAAKVGAEALEYGKRLWAKLRPKVEAKPAAAEAAQDVAAAPEDPRALAALELQLEKLLAQDDELAAAVARVWDEARAAGVVAAGERSVAVGGDVSGIIVTGDDNTVDR